MECIKIFCREIFVASFDVGDGRNEALFLAKKANR